MCEIRENSIEKTAQPKESHHAMEKEEKKEKKRREINIENLFVKKKTTT